MNTIFLLTGWGIGGKPLLPLAQQLQVMGYHVSLVDLPYQAQAEKWLVDLAELLPKQSIWIGWSLGGELLSYLTNSCAKQCLGLITMASNPCFKARVDWPCAMHSTTFNAFQKCFQQAPEQTLRRFLQLVAQGCTDAKSLVRQLQELLVIHPVIAANTGLELLASLDVRQSLVDSNSPQLHIFAEQDALVPMECAHKLAMLLDQTKVMLLPNTGHAFPVQASEQTALIIDNFIKKYYD